ncbi:MAG: hypothetical protein HY843_00190 [Bdellovibrio sp.]|nr:hypothetical protein [Bdellovibrio sp.]
MRDRTRILAFSMLLTVGCPLHPVQYNNLKINFYNAVQKNLSYSSKTDLVLPEPKLYSSSAFPETASQFDCLAVNVMGSGVVSNSDKNPDSFMPDLLAGKFCSYSGITSAPFAQSSSEIKVDLKVPSGKDRIIQVLGILNQGKNLCNQASSLGQMVELTGSYEIAFELGRAQVNLFSNQTVYIENKYDNLSFEEKFKRDVGCSKSSGDNGFNKPTPTASSFFLADSNNNRILIWVTPPTTTQQPADYVLGQADFGTAADGWSNPSAITLSKPRVARTDGTHFFVAEKSNNRVLIWNTIPTTNGQAADIVLGQPNMTSNLGNNGGVSASSLIEPYSVFSTGSQLFVADTSNNRVLIWNTMPTTSGQAADLVLGQSDMSTNNINGGYPVGSIKGSSFKSPTDVFVYDNKLFVADMLNNRILIWSTIPTANNKTADVVLG